MLPGIIKHNQTLFGIKETILFFKKRLDTVYGLAWVLKKFRITTAEVKRFENSTTISLHDIEKLIPFINSV